MCEHLRYVFHHTSLYYLSLLTTCGCFYDIPIGSAMATVMENKVAVLDFTEHAAGQQFNMRLLFCINIIDLLDRGQKALATQYSYLQP